MIIINNKTYSGNNIKVSQGKIFIDGNDVSVNDKNINIVVNGDINSLNVDFCEKIETKNVHDLKTSSGNVNVTGDVKGDISTMSGDVDCDGNVGGNVKTMSGDVKCSQIQGNVSTVSGDIKNKK